MLLSSSSLSFTDLGVICLLVVWCYWGGGWLASSVDPWVLLPSLLIVLGDDMLPLEDAALLASLGDKDTLWAVFCTAGAVKELAPFCRLLGQGHFQTLQIFLRGIGAAGRTPLLSQPDRRNKRHHQRVDKQTPSRQGLLGEIMVSVKISSSCYDYVWSTDTHTHETII